MLDSVAKIDNDHYPQIFLEKCKYAVKKTKIMNIIDEELDPDESDDDDDDDMSDKSDDDDDDDDNMSDKSDEKNNQD